MLNVTSFTFTSFSPQYARFGYNGIGIVVVGGGGVDQRLNKIFQVGGFLPHLNLFSESRRSRLHPRNRRCRDRDDLRGGGGGGAGRDNGGRRGYREQGRAAFSSVAPTTTAATATATAALQMQQQTLLMEVLMHMILVIVERDAAGSRNKHEPLRHGRRQQENHKEEGSQR